MSWKWFFYTFALCVLASPLKADETADGLLKEVETAIATTQSLTTDISGTVHDQRPNRTPLLTFTAKVRLMRPNLARIEYQERTPSEEKTPTVSKQGVVAADGKLLWRYDLQKEEYRSYPVALDGHNIEVANTLPVDSLVYLFFHLRVPHTEVPPTYIGTETWRGQSYRVIEFREPGAAPTDPPRILQRFYIGSDHMIHHFVNEQLQGKYVAECTYTNLRTNVAVLPTTFAYAPPLTAKKHVDTPLPTLAVGTLAPDLTVEDREGKPLKLSDLRGQVVVLDFWTTTCGHCLESQSHLNAIAKKFAGKAIVLALNVGDTREVLAAWLAKHPEYDTMQFALAATPAEKERATSLYQVPGFPMAYVIDKNGKIVKGLLGYDEPTPDLENAILATEAKTR